MSGERYRLTWASSLCCYEYFIRTNQHPIKDIEYPTCQNDPITKTPQTFDQNAPILFQNKSFDYLTKTLPYIYYLIFMILMFLNVFLRFIFVQIFILHLKSWKEQYILFYYIFSNLFIYLSKNTHTSQSCSETESTKPTKELWEV
jgi:hypothetical protein